MQKQKLIILIVLVFFLCGYIYYSSYYSKQADVPSKPTPKITTTPIPTMSKEELAKIAQSIAVKYTVNPKDAISDPAVHSAEMSDLEERLAKAGITKAPESMFNDSTKFPLTEAALCYAYPLARGNQQYRISKEAFEKVLNDVLMSDKQEYKDIFTEMKNNGITIPDKATIPFFNCFILYSKTFANPFVKIPTKDLEAGKIGEYDIIGAFFFLNLESWLIQVNRQSLMENDAFYSFETKDLAITPEIMTIIATNVVYKFNKEEVFFITTFKQPIYIDKFAPIISRAFANYQNNTDGGSISSQRNWIYMNNQCQTNPELPIFSVVKTEIY